MIARLKAYIIGWFRSSQSQPLKDARARRAEALRAAKEAEARHDDRDLGRALMCATQATADVLRLEVGR